MPKNPIDRRLDAYQVIIAATSNQAKSKRELLERLMDEDIDITERTLQSYLLELRSKGVEFEERRINRLMYYKLIHDKDNTFLNFLEYSYFRNHLVDKLNTKNVTRIYREGDKSHVSLETVRIIADAILNQVPLQLHYQKFSGEESTPVLHPYLLKEYNGLWYILGARQTDGDFSLRTYAIDRIKEVVGVAALTYNSSLESTAHAQIKNVIGISNTDQPVQAITMSCDEHEWKYLQINPMHESQTFISCSNGQVLFSLSVVDNYEFRQMVLWHYGRVIVMSPVYLKNCFTDFYTSISITK